MTRVQHCFVQALFSAGDGQLLPGGRTFGGVAGEALGAEGLAAPVACREVFRFDAARVLRPDFPAARVRTLSLRLAGLHTCGQDIRVACCCKYCCSEYMLRQVWTILDTTSASCRWRRISTA